MKTSRPFSPAPLFIIFSLFTGFIFPCFASTNPEAPTILKGSIILGSMRKEGVIPEQYFSFKSGPGAVKLRLAIQPHSDNATVYAELRDATGKSLVKIGDSTSQGKASIKTTAVKVNFTKTFILVISGNAMFYGRHHPRFSVLLGGNVLLSEKAKPLRLIFR